MLSTAASRRERERNLYFFGQPDLWMTWPYLPLVRRTAGKEGYGALCDLFGARGKTGYRATVFMGNLFLLPASEPELLELPKEIFDTLDELYDAGWRVD